LNTSTDTDIDHARPDSIRDIDARLQSAAALAIQAPDRRRLRDARREGRSAELGRATSRWEHGAHGDILDERRVDAGALDERGEGADQQVSGGGVFETALAALGEGGAQRGGDDDVVGVLLEEGG